MKFFLPLTIILICIATYFLYISPTAMEVKALSVKQAQYNTVVQKYQELIKKRDTTLADYNNITQVNIDRLNKIIPERFDSVTFANDLNNIASQNNLTIKDFKVNEPKTEVRDTIINQSKSNLYKTTVVGFKVSGPYPQFLNFLNSIETSLRLMDVSSLDIESFGSGKNGEAIMEYILEVNTYSLR